MHATDSNQHLYVFSDRAQIAFFPLGFLGLMLILGTMLFGVFRFAKVEIENNVVQSVSELLQKEGYGWVSVTASGQQVTLSGMGSAEEGDRAVALAEQATASTWLGQMVAPIAVKGVFVSAYPELPKEPEPVAAEEPMVVDPASVTNPSPQTLPSQWGYLVAQLEDGTLTLSGLVASEARIQAIQDQIQEHLSHISGMEDNMKVAGTELMLGTQELENRVLESLAFCNSGTVSSAGGVFSIDCQTSLDNRDSFTALAGRPLEWGALGEINIDSTGHCNGLLAEKLSSQKIQFSFSSAELRPTNESLLDELAELLKLCPSDIVVEGHTDDSGELAYNLFLSEERANSVIAALVTRGIDEDRIQAKGWGPSRPIAEGSSIESRAANRRIEIHLVNGANQ